MSYFWFCRRLWIVLKSLIMRQIISYFVTWPSLVSGHVVWSIEQIYKSRSSRAATWATDITRRGVILIAGKLLTSSFSSPLSTQAEGSNTPDTRWLGGIVCSSAESGHRLKLWLACLKVALSSPLWQPSKTSPRKYRLGVPKHRTFLTYHKCCPCTIKVGQTCFSSIRST